MLISCGPLDKGWAIRADRVSPQFVSPPVVSSPAGIFVTQRSSNWNELTIKREWFHNARNKSSDRYKQINTRLILASRVWISSLCFSCFRTRNPTFLLAQAGFERASSFSNGKPRAFYRCRHLATASAQRGHHREFCFGRMSGWCLNPFFIFSPHFAIYFREFYSGIDRDPQMRRALAIRSPAAKSR
jgi:hypothetical protein